MASGKQVAKMDADGDLVNLRPATSLQEISARATLEPLASGDPRYVDMADGRASRALRQMRLHIEDHDAEQLRYAKVAFTGHRGCGKSTELLRMEHDLAGRFTCVHLYVDENLVRDCEYSDLLLWLVESLFESFKRSDLNPPDDLVKGVANWFAEKSLEEVEAVKGQVQAEIGAEASAGIFGLKLIARIKAMVQGNIEQRRLIRLKLQSYGSQLVERVNDLLDWGQKALVKQGKRPDILIIQDNLDRLPVDVGRKLFFDNGDLLKRLRAHMIFTHPIAMVLAPANIGAVFENCFTMPMVKVQHRDGRSCKEGIEALIDLIKRRASIEQVFTDAKVARYLVILSGGSVRDLLRLLNYSQLEARTDGKSIIDQESAERAVKRLRIDFERLLIPSNVYFPLLADVHRNKDVATAAGEGVDANSAQAARDFFSELLFNGTVLEYNGDRNWYDVHPVVREIEAFRNAVDR